MFSASTFLRKGRQAISQREEHVIGFQEFDAALPKDDVVRWTAMVHAWEKDPEQNTNPFEAISPRITENQVCLELALEDEARFREDLTSNIQNVLHDDVPPGHLIAQGLELEDLQRLLRNEIKALKSHSTSLQRSKVIERSNRLFRKIEAWIGIQILYMPMTATLRLRDDQLGDSEHVATADVKLYLLSMMLGKAYCDLKFVDIEWRLRFAQAHETLYEIRSAILLRSQMYKSKDILVRGQRMHTRSLALLQTVSDRIMHGMVKYNEIHAALVALGNALHKTGWENVLKVLTVQDLGGITAFEDSRSERSRSMSWIWKLSDADAMEGESKQEALRIEWCKARARAHRWQEECVLLNEEMRRVLAFFVHQDQVWNARSIVSYSHVDPVTAAGMRAYAQRQA
ncbi:hypothetical protein C0992_000615, partial [Termitomyces sp. T32_za158]